MDNIKNTYAEINCENIKENVEKIISKNQDYEYYIGVVKADSYGHQGLDTVEYIIKGGVNYLAVATITEAIEIRKKGIELPILCLGLVDKEDLGICMEKNITITIPSLEYFNSIKDTKMNLKVHIKLNTGMNRLGISDKKEFLEIYSELKNTTYELEGIYTHMYKASSKECYQKQVEKYEELTNEINLEEIKIRHISASDALTRYEKPQYINGARLGIIMYGITDDKNLKLKSTFALYSRVIQINNIEENETVGYEGNFKANKKTKVAVVPIGYADGIIRKNTGRKVYINNRQYNIVGNICMDMLFVEIDEKVNILDKVVIIKDNKHIYEIAKYLETIPYEIFCSIGKRVKRIYIKK